MTFINPQPETPVPIIKPREGETLQSWLTRKNHAILFYNFELLLNKPHEMWEVNKC